ncbi:unnamed protein product [Urochloa humidicola]
MVVGSITGEVAMAMPAELLWKAVFASADESSIRNLITGLSDLAVQVDGDGGPGTRFTLKFNLGVGRTTMLVKSRLAMRDDAARVISYDEVVTVWRGGSGSTVEVAGGPI